VSTPSEIHVAITHAAPTRVDPEELRARWLPLLTTEERRKHDAYHFDRHRHEYLVTRALCLTTLGVALSRPVRELAFVRNAYGRPELASPSPLRFNLTNSLGLVVCAVVEGREIGIDVEAVGRADEILGIAEAVFTGIERRELDRLELPARRRRAVELWTLKEAYMKARGMGMSLAPSSFELSFDGPRAALGLVGATDPEPSRWQFFLELLDGHLVSGCVDAGDRPLRLAWREVDLLREQRTDSPAGG